MFDKSVFKEYLKSYIEDSLKMVIGGMSKMAIKKPIKLSAYEGQLKHYL